MTTARDQILGTIRRSLGRERIDPAKRAELDARLSTPAKGIIPARTAGSDADRLALFREMAEAVQCTLQDVATMGDVPKAVAGYLSQHNLPSGIKMADHADLTALDWAGDAPTLAVKVGATRGDDLVSLSMAFAGVAETGTLVLLSGPDGPTTLNFLPETHIVVLPQSALRGSYEEVWDMLRAQQAGCGEKHLPRTVNMITGPSRTGDIEQTILLGAHGPHHVHILMVADA